MGMMLSCSRDALPGTAGAFLIATADLRISAVSEAGERFFGEEQSRIGTEVLDVLTSPLGDDLLARRLAEAATRASEPLALPVRLLGEGAPRVGTMAARVGTCGPPRAALLSVEPSEFGRR